jgi:hypothetical protein
MNTYIKLLQFRSINLASQNKYNTVHILNKTKRALRPVNKNKKIF